MWLRQERFQLCLRSYFCQCLRRSQCCRYSLLGLFQWHSRCRQPFFRRQRRGDRNCEDRSCFLGRRNWRPHILLRPGTGLSTLAMLSRCAFPSGSRQIYHTSHCPQNRWCCGLPPLSGALLCRWGWVVLTWPVEMQLLTWESQWATIEQIRASPQKWRPFLCMYVINCINWI